jgi:hypothetical protein
MYKRNLTCTEPGPAARLDMCVGPSSSSSSPKRSSPVSGDFAITLVSQLGIGYTSDMLRADDCRGNLRPPRVDGEGDLGKQQI